jgi:dihydrofolate reductase
MAEYWPTGPKDPIADAMNGMTKIVFSRTLRTANWNNSSVAADVAGEIAKLKALPGLDIVMLGSLNLAGTLPAFNLFDEYQIVLCPVVIGRGLALFPNLRTQLKLQLREARARRSGAVELCYVPERSPP